MANQTNGRIAIEANRPATLAFVSLGLSTVAILAYSIVTGEIVATAVGNLTLVLLMLIVGVLE